MRASIATAIVLTVLVAATPPCIAEPTTRKPDPKVEQQRTELKQLARSTLEDLYRLQPRARGVLESAAGYAVFSNFGLKILVGGGGSGRGIAFDRSGTSVVYMRMAELQAGLGISAKKYRQVWVFENASDLDKFVNSGWELGGQTTLSAQLNGKGGEAFTGALSVRPGVWIYQLTGDGLAVDLTAKGTKYYRNRNLN